MKMDMLLMGAMNWKEFRDLLIKELKKVDSEEMFRKLMIALDYSFSKSEEEAQKKRRKLGLPET
jgi:hypothetical protein